MELLFLLLLLVLFPVLFILVGLIMVFNANKEKAKKGGRYILYGLLILLTEGLIGFAICSNMNLGGFH